MQKSCRDVDVLRLHSYLQTKSSIYAQQVTVVMKKNFKSCLPDIVMDDQKMPEHILENSFLLF
jgi:hypothetical protein